MRRIKNGKITDLKKALLLLALPTGILPKKAVMRLDVVDYLPDGFTKQDEDRLRWRVVCSAVRYGMLKQKTFTTKVHNRANTSIVYLLTFAGLDYLVRVASDEYPWLKDVAFFYADRATPLYENLNNHADVFYRDLAIADFEMMVRAVHAELSQGYASGTLNIAIREEMNAAFSAAEGDEEDYDDDVNCNDLLHTCRRAYLAHHPDEPLIESVLPQLPCDGLFINSRLCNFVTPSQQQSEKEKEKRFFHSNALGVYLNQNHSFAVFHSTRYGMTWDERAIKVDIEKFRNVKDILGYRSEPANALILIDGKAQFLELFRNKWKRKRHYSKRKMDFGTVFQSIYAIPNNSDGYYPLEMAEYHGRGYDTAMTNIVCYERHYGILLPTRSDTYHCTLDGLMVLIGSALNVIRINKAYQDYCEDIKKGRPFLFAIYCEWWQKEWFEDLFPGVEVYTEDDLPYCNYFET